MNTRYVRHLGAAIVTPLRCDQPQGETPRIWSLFAVGDDLFLVRSRWIRRSHIAVATSFVLGTILSRLWTQWVYAFSAAALALHLVAWRDLRNALRSDIARVVRSGEALRINRYQAAEESKDKRFFRRPKHNLVAECDGRVFGVLIGEQVRKSILDRGKGDRARSP